MARSIIPWRKLSFFGYVLGAYPAHWSSTLRRRRLALGDARAHRRHGRTFADDGQNSLYTGASLTEAIEQATQRWIGWTIGRETSKDYSIPRGLPYLTGFVLHCEIGEDISACLALLRAGSSRFATRVDRARLKGGCAVLLHSDPCAT